MVKTLKCRRCGNALIYVNDDNQVKAKNVVLANIRGYAPKEGDVFGLTCKCGFHIIGLTNEYLYE